MRKYEGSVTIHAPAKTIWETVIGEETYPLWTAEFAPGSRVDGEWREGERLRFLAPAEDGSLEGMVSRVAELRPYEFISIEHLGWVKGGVEDTTSDEISDWAGAREEYTLTERDGAVEFAVEMDSTEESIDYFEETWPKALNRLKELAEDAA
jgi:uncharacterized protein YndB with AHSA1/START domain